MTPPHYPPHLCLPATWYMVTVGTHKRLRLLEAPSAKELVRSEMATLSANLQLELRAWVILDNHYHLLLKADQGEALTAFFRRLHGRTSFQLNAHDAARGRQVWHNYWDTCIRTDAGFWSRLNYIHWNPVRHGYVNRPEDWPFSSLGWFIEHVGYDWVRDLQRRYPVDDLVHREDLF